MNFIINKTYFELSDYAYLIQTKGDVVDVMANRGEPRTLIIHYKNLSPDLFDPTTGFALFTTIMGDIKKYKVVLINTLHAKLTRELNRRINGSNHKKFNYN